MTNVEPKWRWTDSLTEPLARRLRDGEYTRVEKGKHIEGWLLLPRREDGHCPGWLRIPSEDAPVEVLSPLADTRLEKLPGVVATWLAEGRTIRLLAHKVGSRATFRLDDSFAKLYRKDRHLMVRWEHFPHELEGGWRVPRVLSWDGKLRLLVAEGVPGEALHDRWRHGRGVAEDGDRIASLLGWLRERPLLDTPPPHTVAEESRILRDRVPELSEFVVDPPTGVGDVVDRVIEALESDPRGEEFVTGHRDLHDKQILIDGPGEGALIDLDLATLVPAALDTGNILAHVRLRAFQGNDLPWQKIAGRITDAAETSSLRGSIHRWTAATLLRLTLIYSRRRRAKGQLEAMLESTIQALEQRGEWEGIL